MSLGYCKNTFFPPHLFARRPRTETFFFYFFFWLTRTCHFSILYWSPSATAPPLLVPQPRPFDPFWIFVFPSGYLSSCPRTAYRLAGLTRKIGQKILEQPMIDERNMSEYPCRQLSVHGCTISAHVKYMLLLLSDIGKLFKYVKALCLFFFFNIPIYPPNSRFWLCPNPWVTALSLNLVPD